MKYTLARYHKFLLNPVIKEINFLFFEFFGLVSKTQGIQVRSVCDFEILIFAKQVFSIGKLFKLFFNEIHKFIITQIEFGYPELQGIKPSLFLESFITPVRCRFRMVCLQIWCIMAKKVMQQSPIPG